MTTMIVVLLTMTFAPAMKTTTHYSYALPRQWAVIVITGVAPCRPPAAMDYYRRNWTPSFNRDRQRCEMMRPRFLNKDEFAQVVRNTPLVSIDLIIRNPDQRVLVGLRTSEPAKGKWFVPGGVVLKDERLADAFARIVKAETGLEASIGDAKFVGVYEHLYDSNVFGQEGFGTHYVVLAHELSLDHQPPIVSDLQHSGFRWMTPAELTSSPEVHQYTGAYFL